jgi:hypothetical protein
MLDAGDVVANFEANYFTVFEKVKELASLDLGVSDLNLSHLQMLQQAAIQELIINNATRMGLHVREACLIANFATKLCAEVWLMPTPFGE